MVKRKTAGSRFRRAVKKIAEWCRLNRHLPLREQHQALTQKLRGHYQYYGVIGNLDSLKRFHYEVMCQWRKWLSRRKRRGQYPVAAVPRLAERVQTALAARGGCHRAQRGRDLTSRMPESGTSGRVHQNAAVVTPSPAASELPIIAVAALLQLVDWYHARRQRNLPGGASCVNPEPPLSPPAPANTPAPAVPTVAGTARRRPRTDSQRAQPRRGRAPHAASQPAGGDA